MASQKTLIRRSKVLRDPLGGQFGLLRETGLINDKRSGMLKIWGLGIQDRMLLRMTDEAEITTLVFDETMQGGILGLKMSKGTRDWSEIRYIPHNSKDRPPWDALESPGSQISSMSLSPNRHLLVTELGGEFSASHVNLDFVAGEHGGAFGDDIGQGGLLPRIAGISHWASAANPYSEVASFAIAASNGSLVISQSQARWLVQIGDRYSGAPEVMAVDWLSPKVLIKGCKDGGVRLWDTRSFEGESRESRIQHPSQINHARRVDENTIVVAGLESQLCTYDLRFLSDLARPGQVTRPYNRFLSYENLDLGHLATGFDVRGDLIAAVTDVGRIIIWDVKCGRQLRKTRWRTPLPTGDAICLQFAEGGSRREGVRLMASAKLGVTELAW